MGNRATHIWNSTVSCCHPLWSELWPLWGIVFIAWENYRFSGDCLREWGNDFNLKLSHWACIQYNSAITWLLELMRKCFEHLFRGMLILQLSYTFVQSATYYCNNSLRIFHYFVFIWIVITIIWHKPRLSYKWPKQTLKVGQAIFFINIFVILVETLSAS